MVGKSKKTLVAETLRSEIRSGILRHGTKLPRGTELAKRFDVSHITIRAALYELANEGIIQLVHGCGTFVSSCGMPITSGKILVIRESFHLLHSVSSYIVPDFEKRCCELQLMTDGVNTEYLLASPRKQVLRTFECAGYTGILIPVGSFSENHPLVEFLQMTKVPVLIAHGTRNDRALTGFSVLRTDEASAWDEGAKYLVSLGYRRIAVLSNARFKVKYYDRVGFLQRLAFFGAEPISELVVSSTDDDKDFQRKLKQLLKHDPEAIFCGSDFFAMRVCDFLSHRKVRVPEDIAVLGFGGNPGGQVFSPALSTVDFNFAGIGRLAAELLNAPKNWYSPGAPIERFTPHRLLIRSSTESSS